MGQNNHGFWLTSYLIKNKKIIRWSCSYFPVAKMKVGNNNMLPSGVQLRKNN